MTRSTFITVRRVSCAASLGLALTLGACAEGGSDDRPQSEIKIAAGHHLFGFRALGAFTSFPVDPAQVFPDRGRLDLFDDSTYTVTRGANTSPADTYALERSGELTMVVTGSGREPSVIFRGAYGLEGDTNHFFFTDRVTTASSPSLGVFFGTRTVPGQVDLAGKWFLFAQHIVFASSPIQDPDNVARGTSGTLDVATGNPGDALAITGTGTESTRALLDFSGTMQNLLDSGGTGDGEVNLTLTWQEQNMPTTADERVFDAAVGAGLMLAVDFDETDGEAGLAFLVRAHDAPANPADPTKVAGDFLVGAQTAFVNPRAPGSDAAIGTLELTPQGGFRFDMVGANGVDFSYRGTFTLEDEGRLTFDVNGTNETWIGAISPDYASVIVSDAFIETRSNNTPEINVFMAFREKPPL